MAIRNTKTLQVGRQDSTSLPITPPNLAGTRVVELASAFLGCHGDRALGILVRASNDGWDLQDIEALIIVPAVGRICQMRLRGRIDELALNQAGALAEAVERAFRKELARKTIIPFRRRRVAATLH